MMFLLHPLHVPTTETTLCATNRPTLESHPSTSMCSLTTEPMRIHNIVLAGNDKQAIHSEQEHCGCVIRAAPGGFTDDEVGALRHHNDWPLLISGGGRGRRLEHAQAADRAHVLPPIRLALAGTI